MQTQQLAGREPIVETEMLRQESDFAARLHISLRLAKKKSFSARRPDQAQKHFDGRALARSVRPKKSENRAARNGQRKVPYRDLASVLFAQTAGFNREVLKRWQNRAPRLIERIGHRNGVARISVANERIYGPVFGPQQSVSGPATSRHIQKRAMHSIDLDRFVRTHVARNRHSESRLPIHVLEELLRLRLRHAGELKRNLCELLQVEPCRNVHRWAWPFAQQDAVRILHRTGNR